MSRPTPASVLAGAEDVLADERVTAHELLLVGSERSRLLQDAVRDRDLADVVELRGPHEVRGLLAVQAEPAPDGGCEARHVADVVVRSLVGQNVGGDRRSDAVEPVEHRDHDGRGEQEAGDHAEVGPSGVMAQGCDRDRQNGGEDDDRPGAQPQLQRMSARRAGSHHRGAIGASGETVSTKGPPRARRAHWVASSGSRR
jgi:hypothetical protein